jgi:hypothetical protein
MQSSEEMPLSGGWVNQVVRIGDTVHRSAGAWTPAVHALMRHLESVGFAEAPRVLGMDDQGREVLTYIEGEVGTTFPPELLTDDGLAALGALLRRYHDAVSGYAPPKDAVWRVGQVALAAGWVVCHGDFGVWNIVYRYGHPVGIIDWDFAEPGPPIHDLAKLAWSAVPLNDGGSEALIFEGLDRRHRLRVLCDAYGRRVMPPALLEVVSQLQAMELSRLLDWGGKGIEPWASFLPLAEEERIRADVAWLKEHRADLI